MAETKAATKTSCSKATYTQNHRSFDGAVTLNPLRADASTSLRICISHCGSYSISISEPARNGMMAWTGAAKKPSETVFFQLFLHDKLFISAFVRNNGSAPFPNCCSLHFVSGLCTAHQLLVLAAFPLKVTLKSYTPIHGSVCVCERRT